MPHPTLALTATIMLFSGALTLAAAQEERSSAAEWLERCRAQESRRTERHCEVREERMAAPVGVLQVNGRPNGGINVVGWDRDEVLVRARIQAQARTAETAARIGSEVRITAAGNEISATGPNREGRESWSVSYDVFVPRGQELNLRSTNGGLRVVDVSGRLKMQTTNGGITLDGVSGAVTARTTNGGVRITMAGGQISPDGLDIRTTNGSVRLALPDGVNAHLEARTTNGGMTVDFPIQVQGRLGRSLSTDLGNGGPTIRAVTTNGSVRVTRR